MIGSESKSNELPFCDSVSLQLGLKKVGPARIFICLAVKKK